VGESLQPQTRLEKSINAEEKRKARMGHPFRRAVAAIWQLAGAAKSGRD